MGHLNRVTFSATGDEAAPVIVLAGDLDMSTAPLLDAELAPILSSHPHTLTFDLSSVTFLDSSGLSALIRASNQVDKIVVRAPTPAARLVLEATGLDDVFAIES